MPKVKPDILRWARETAQISIDEAANKLRLGPIKDATPVDRMLALESGDKEPSRPLLLRMAKLYRRPLLTFYLSKPPIEADRGQDFRKVPDTYSPKDDVLLNSLIRDVQARQDLIRVVLEDDEEVQPLFFVGSATMSDGPKKVVSAIQTTINTDLVEYRSQNSIDEAFKMLRSRTEAAGIFILLLGNLGSHHTNIGLETFRGYALADDIAPFVVINENDSHGAWSFTLIHELAHIWLGLTGVSGLDNEHSVEQFCNEVAGEFLLPKKELVYLAVSDSTHIEEAQRLISEFALDRNISSSMVAYRLYLTGKIAWAQWRKLSESFRSLWMNHRDKQRERLKERGGGPSYYLLRAHRAGSTLIDTVGRLLAAGSLTTSKAGKVLGVRPKNVKRLIDTGSPTPL